MLKHIKILDAYGLDTALIHVLDFAFNCNVYTVKP